MDLTFRHVFFFLFSDLSFRKVQNVKSVNQVDAFGKNLTSCNFCLMSIILSKSLYAHAQVEEWFSILFKLSVSVSVFVSFSRA